MKPNSYPSLILLSCLLLLASCVEKNTYEPTEYVISFTPTLNADVSMLDFGYNGGSSDIRIISNTFWEASTSEEWLSVSPTSGTGPSTLTVEAKANLDFSARMGTITVALKTDSTKTITVAQSPTPVFGLSTDSIGVKSSADSQELKVFTNQSWTASTNVSWITLSKTSGKEDDVVVVQVTKNSTHRDRKGLVLFKSGGDTYSVVVTQPAAPYLEASPSSMVFTSYGESLSIVISSNLLWKVSTTASWLTLSPLSGSNEAKITAVATENSSYESRSGKVTITADGFTANISVTQRGKYQTGDYDYNDLGLPSGTLWATMNVGATSPEDDGEYFAWGEIQTKEEYTWDTYKWCNGNGNSMTKYNISSAYGTVDNKTALVRSDDIAYERWGNPWHVPNSENWSELANKENCTWIWTSLNGVEGYKVISVKNGRSIFLPAAGFRSDASLYYEGKYGYYWSSSLYEDKPNSAWSVRFSSSQVDLYSGERYSGRIIRPVCLPE